MEAGVQLAWETRPAGTHRGGQGGISLASAAGRGSSSQSLLTWRHRVGLGVARWGWARPSFQDRLAGLSRGS